jgi:cysteine desulfurase family protein (TIGR01976 family)
MLGMTFDVATVRSHFPALKEGAAHFDSPGGTQTPELVADAVHSTLVAAIANRGTVTAAELKADEVVTAARHAMGDLLSADPAGVVFGRSMTQLTFDLAHTMSKEWVAGDEVVVSRLDHDGNVRPWVIAAERAGATVRWIDFDPESAELTPDDVQAQLSDRTRIVALTGASNLIGTRPDLATIADLVHATGALFYVDGVHLTAHAAIDVSDIGADLFVCSPYKFFGPHCGVVAGRVDVLERLRPDKLLPSSDAVPERFELGTLPYELLAGTTAAVDFIAGLAGDAPGGRRARLLASMAIVERHEDRLRERTEEAVEELHGITIRSRARHRTPTLLLTFDGRPSDDAYGFLAQRGVNAPASSFYAYEASRRLGLGSAGGLRVGFAPYNDDQDVDRLIEGLTDFMLR